MKYFIDTEFEYTAGPAGAAIIPISIGIVAEDGREFYRVNRHVFYGPDWLDRLPPFVREHVVPVLDATKDNAMPFASIAYDLRFFIGDDTPEFWGEYSAFDYVVLSTIMGGFEHWPEGWPMWINDLQQDAIPSVESKQPHNALADARAVRDSYEWAYGNHPPIDASA